MEYRWNTDPEGDLLDQLVALSNMLGSDPTVTQAGGGNTSVKWEEKDFAGRTVPALRVKGSGTDLATIQRKGFTGLRLEDVRGLRDCRELSDEAMTAYLDGCRLAAREPAPSVETVLHAALPYRFIVHTHEFASLSLTNTPHAQDHVREVFGDEVRYVPYIRPGFGLARAVMDLGPLGDARGLALGNHGLVTWGETARECYDNLFRLVTRAEEFLKKAGAGKNLFGAIRRPPLDPARRRAAMRELLPVLRGRISPRRRTILHWDDSEEILRFVGSERAAELSQRGVVTLEHIMRCGRMPLFVEADPDVLKDAVDGYRERGLAALARHGKTKDPSEVYPRVVLLPGLGMVTAMKDKKNAQVTAECYRHTVRVIEAAENIERFQFIDEASAVEIECWALENAKLKQAEKDLSRRIAVVSGVGQALADRLAAEGAQVAASLEEAVLSYGGVDIVVAAGAGAESLAREATLIMKRQGGGEIVLDSEALARRLGERAIRVNAVVGSPLEAAADLVIFLASDRSRPITGAAIPVDGGLTGTSPR